MAAWPGTVCCPAVHLHSMGATCLSFCGELWCFQRVPSRVLLLIVFEVCSYMRCGGLSGVLLLHSSGWHGLLLPIVLIFACCSSCRAVWEPALGYTSMPQALQV